MSVGPRELFAALRGAVFASLFVALWTWLATLVRRFDPALGVEIPAGLAAVGWASLAAGGALALTCIALFATRGRGTPAPFDPPREFVASGPYRHVRNPMYLGAILALVGGGLVVRSAAVVLLAAGFWLLAHLFVVAYEEPALEATFGDSYRRYKERVNRWAPRRSGR